MKLSSLPFIAVNFKEEDSIKKWLEFASKIGLDGVELSYQWPIDWHLIYRTKRWLREQGLVVSAITTESNLSRFTPEGSKEEIEKLRGYMDLALELNTDILILGPGDWFPIWHEFSRQRATNVVVEILEECLDYAQENGIIFALENLHWMGLDKKIIQAILEKVKSPNLGWNFDTENAYRLEGQTAFDFLNEKSILGRLVYTHVKNFKESPQGWIPSCSLAEGVLDIKEMLKTVKSSGYDGWLSIEYGGNNLEDVRKSANYLKDIWPKL